MPDPAEPLAIVGMSCLFPKADSLDGFWRLVKSGADGITPVPPTHWNPADYFNADPKLPDHTYAQRGGFLDAVDFNPAQFGIAPNDLEAIDTAQLLGLVVAQRALADAGIVTPCVDANGPRISVVLGVTGTLELVIPLGARLGHPLWRKALKEAGIPDDQANDAVERIAAGYVPWQENSFPGLLGNVVAGRIANRLNLNGTNCVVDAACASSLSAMHLAALELQAGRSDVVLTGGVDTFNDIFMYMCFSKTPALSATGDARPFSTDGDGTILGEGLGMVVLKRLADAERDGDRIYAVIKGIGSSSDGKGNAVYAPVAAGQERCLRDAYQISGVSPSTVELVEGHGTGTKVGDATEASALATVFAASERSGTWCALGSVKSQIGHTKAAAGAAGLIKAALALHHQLLPPTAKVQRPLDAVAPGMTPLYVNTTARPWLAVAEHPRRAAVSAFGFGGSNFHAVLEEYDGPAAPDDFDGDTQIVAFAAESAVALATLLERYDAGPSWAHERANALATRRAFHPAAYRAAFVWRRDDAKRRDQLTDAARRLRAGEALGSGAPGKLAMLFPGQGSQAVGMLRDIACNYSVARDVLAAADANYRTATGRRLVDAIYPHPAFDAATKRTQDEALRDTATAQPALAAVSLAALKLLERFGVRPDLVAGHSFGELVALHAADVYSAESLFALAQTRGRLMADAGGSGGAMLAVHAAPETLDALVRDAGLSLVVANRNSPQQAVLSGAADEIDRAAYLLGERGLRWTRLPVSAAFHSPLVADAAKPFRATMAAIDFASPARPVFSNTTATPYPSDADAARDLLANQLANPVRFAEELLALHDAGARTYVEVGPGSVLTRLAEATLAGKPFTALSMETAGLATVLARLATLGYAVDLAAWDPLAPPVPMTTGKPQLTVPICGANYVKPRAVRAVTPRTSHASPGAAPSVAAAAPKQQAFGSGAAAATDGAAPGDAWEVRGVTPPRPSPPKKSAMNDPVPASALGHALQATQESLHAFQRMQEQTAQLHRQFLETQETAQRTLLALVEGQQRLLGSSLRLPAASLPPAVPLPTPAPRPVAPPPAVVAPPKPVYTPPPPVTAAPKPVAPAPAAASPVQATLLAVVAEKTGYPIEMLDLDMGLDADLGIDSIKRVEILSALQDKLPDAPAVKPEHLGTLHTLRHIVEFLGELSAEPGRGARGAAGGNADRLDRSHPAPPSPLPDILLAVVAEKTGYPVEMLDLDMGLDADLGIDSIKRVEILSALQDKLPDAPAVKPEHLGTLHTLRHIADFLSSGPPTPPAAERAAPASLNLPAPATPAGSEKKNSPLTRQVLGIAPLLDDDARPLARPASGSEVWLIADAEPLADAVAAKLGNGYRLRRWSWTDTNEDAVASRLGALILLAPADLPADLPKRAFRWLRQASTALRKTGAQAGATLLAVSRLDGQFGLGGGRGFDPVGGAFAGLAKTAAREWSEVNAKALDLSPALNIDAAASRIAEELRRRGPEEIGITSGGLWVPTLSDKPLSLAVPPGCFHPGDVVAISGGARGVTAEVAVALAEAYQVRLLLLGRNPLPAEEDAELAASHDDAAIKRLLLHRAGGKLSPRELEGQCKTVHASREIRQTLARIVAAGGEAKYRSVDVRDAGQVAAAFAEVRQSWGPIAGIVHGAGVLADKRIEDKTADGFSSVYGTKAEGANALLAAAGDDPLKLIALFSSSTARFGRVGQCDYAAANEVLNKLAQREAKRRPSCRVVALNWGPWAGGMVTPGLRGVFAQEGVGLIPLADGAAHLIAELAAPDRAVEVVILGPTPAKSSTVETTAITLPERVLPPMTLAFERLVDAERLPILRDHVIDGRPVMPLALTLEWLAHAALHSQPGLLFVGASDLRVLTPIAVPAGHSTKVRAYAGKATREAGEFHVPVELRVLRADGRELPAARAEIALANSVPAAPSATGEMKQPPCPVTVDDLYAERLFHGPDLRGIESIVGCGDGGVSVMARPATAPADWLNEPLRGRWLADPLLVDCAFQAMILWCQQERGGSSLPTYVSDYRQFVRQFPAGEVRIDCRAKPGSGAVAKAEIEFVAADGTLLARIDGYECVIDAGLGKAFRKRQLVEGSAT